MSFLTPYEMQKLIKEKCISDDANERTEKKRPELPWSSDVLKNNEPRAKLESPLKRWWLEQQALKKQQEISNTDVDVEIPF